MIVTVLYEPNEQEETEVNTFDTPLIKLGRGPVN